MAESLKYYDEIITTYLNQQFPNDIENFEKIQYTQLQLNRDIYDDRPNYKQAIINVLNRLKQENTISISESEPALSH